MSTNFQVLVLVKKTNPPGPHLKKGSEEDSCESYVALPSAYPWEVSIAPQAGGAGSLAPLGDVSVFRPALPRDSESDAARTPVHPRATLARPPLPVTSRSSV